MEEWEGSQRAATVCRPQVMHLATLSPSSVLCKMRAREECIFVNDDLFLQSKILLLLLKLHQDLIIHWPHATDLQPGSRFLHKTNIFIQGFADSLIYARNIHVHYYSI